MSNWICLVSFASFLSAAAGQEPTIVHVGMVNPTTVGITVQAGRIEYGRQVPYSRQPADEVRMKGKEREVYRQGKFLGWLVGKAGNLLYTEDTLVGDPLDAPWADAPASYRVTSSEDRAYTAGVTPRKVFRKSKPSDFGRWHGWPYRTPVRHVLYLELPRPLVEGKQYTIRFQGKPWKPVTFRFDPRRLRSEAVHVSQVGFRPDDPVKRAFLSLWRGNGGPLQYAEEIRFHVAEDATRAEVFSDRARLIHRPGQSEDAYKKDYARTFVYELDFSPVDRPGTYRVWVEGVGCSYPFPIAADAWAKAFFVSARGFYHQRSGVALGPPYTEYHRPRCFHPADGVKVYQSTCPLMDSGNGLNAKGTDKNNFGNLVKGKTDRIVPDAWGGYMDAGDWDRRIQHLIVSRYLLDLADMFPDFFASLSLHLPESHNTLPDIVDEALFGLDFYRRLQTPAGGVRGGIESAEHPRHGECSWQESLTVMAYAPGLWSSYVYAGAAAQAARWFQKRDKKRAALYRESALRAMRWAEKRLNPAVKYPLRVNDDRNLAAAELFRLTGDGEWNRVFLATTAFHDPRADLFVWKKHEQREAAWVYAATTRPGVDETVRAHCRAAILREADERLQSTTRTSFEYAKYAWQPGVGGAFSSPDAVTLVRAHRLTGNVNYLKAALLACLTGAGANPVNLCYTTGLGSAWPRHPLHLDSRLTHQPPPPGLTVFGPIDVIRDKNYWAQKIVARVCFPPVGQWPTLEAYWDVFWYPPMCEFTVQLPMARNAYVYGYLAAR